MTTQKIKSQEIGTIGKIIIPQEIENMIDFLHKSIGATEWSGILFYKMTSGDINKLSNLEFKTEFLYPMNIGSSAYTEFDYNSEVMNAYELREDLIECSTSMLHTHHSMQAFFSGTDTDELLANCVHFNYYISLIVNFSKEYKCKIAFPSKTSTVSSYSIKDSNGQIVIASKTVEEDNVIIGDLTIEFENTIETPEWLDKRVKELKVKKATPIVTKAPLLPGRTYPAQVSVNNYTPKSYNDFEFENDWNSWKTANNVVTKTLPTPKQFLACLLSLDDSGETYGLEGAIMSTELAFQMQEVDYDMFDTAISGNIEGIHDAIYGSDRLFSSHCQSALNVLDSNEQLFSDFTVYQIIKENLEIYAK